MKNLIGPKESAAVVRRGGRVVYFIEARGSGLVKIGIALDPMARLLNLKTANPEGLALLGVIPDPNPEALEQHLHRQFQSLRVGGEWFRPDAALRYYIERFTMPLGAYQQQLINQAVAKRDRPKVDNVVAFPSPSPKVA